MPLLRGEGRQPDKAVLAGFDARNHLDGRPPADAPGNRGGHRRVAHERHRERFEGRHIDQLAVARPLEAGPRRQGACCTVGTGDPFAETAADGQRLATPRTVVMRGSRQGLEKEVVRRTSAARAREAEGRERHHGEFVVHFVDMGEAKASGHPIAPADELLTTMSLSASRFEHPVVAGGGIEVSDDAALPGGEETEQDAIRVAVSAQRSTFGTSA